MRAIGAELRPSDRAEQCGDETRFDYLKKPFLGQVKYRYEVLETSCATPPTRGVK